MVRLVAERLLDAAASASRARCGWCVSTTSPPRAPSLWTTPMKSAPDLEDDAGDLRLSRRRLGRANRGGVTTATASARRSAPTGAVASSADELAGRRGGRLGLPSAARRDGRIGWRRDWTPRPAAVGGRLGRRSSSVRASAGERRPGLAVGAAASGSTSSLAVSAPALLVVGRSISRRSKIASPCPGCR